MVTHTRREQKAVIEPHLSLRVKSSSLSAPLLSLSSSLSLRLFLVLAEGARLAAARSLSFSDKTDGTPVGLYGPRRQRFKSTDGEQ